jgi:hypothetical protein
MSSLIPTNVEVPAHLAGRVGQPSTLAESLGGGLAKSVEFPRISIKASRFRIVEGGAETVLNDTTLEVVIVGANPRLSKAWYAEAWTPDVEASAPDCFTLDGITHDPESAQPQHPVCASCPQNAWGSRVTPQGTKVKACSDKKRLAVVAATDPSGPTYLLEVTAAALKGLNQYQRELTMRGIAPEIVKTAVSFDTSASFPKLQFGFGGFIDEQTQTIVDKLFGSDKVKQITGETSANIAIAAPPAEEAKAPEPVVEAQPEVAPEQTGVSFGQSAPSAAPPVAETPSPVATPTKSAPAAPAAPVAEEPTAAPVANESTAALADEITALMAEVSDDA